MTRQVFANAMTAHVWAQMTQDSGRSQNGNFYFEGRALFSYGRHYVAGYMLAPSRALINATGYSISTARHVRLADRAVSWNGASVPDLTSLARVLDSAFEMVERGRRMDDPARVKAAQIEGRAALAAWIAGERFPTAKAEAARVASRINRAGAPNFPEIPAAGMVWAFESLGLSPAEADRAALRALAQRESNRMKWNAAEAKAKAAAILETAKRLAARPLADLRGEMLAETRGPYFRAERHGAEWLGIARQHFRAAKAAKAKGWARVAAEVKARESLIRAEVKRWPEIEAAANARAYIRESFRMIRAARDMLGQTDPAPARAAYTLAEALKRAEVLGLIYPRGGAYVTAPHARADLGRIMARAGLLTAEAGQGWERWAEACRALAARLERADSREGFRRNVERWRIARGLPEDSDNAAAFDAARAACLYLGDSGWRVAGNPCRAAGWTPEALKAEAARWAAKAEAARAAKKAKDAAALAAWLTGARDAWRAGLKAPERPEGLGMYQAGRALLDDGQGGAMLKAVNVTRDDSGAVTGGTLQTSQGAEVPLTHAIRAFRFLKLCRDAGREWRANGKTLPVGHFRIDSIDAAGNFRAGCHRINWPEVERVAAALGLADLAPADTTESRPHAAA